MKNGKILKISALLICLFVSKGVFAQYFCPDIVFSNSRQHQMTNIVKPRDYEVGKFTKYGATTSRTTVFEMNEPGVLKRLWTTHAKGENLWLEIYIDNPDKPFISGPAHELAAAASRVSTPHVPIGGFFDQKSVNLYLPIKFSKMIKIVSEPIDTSGRRPYKDGPYWQVDYILGDTDEFIPEITQKTENGQIIFECLDEEPVKTDSEEQLLYYDEIFELSGCGVKNIILNGPGIIKSIEICSDDLESIIMRGCYDREIVDKDSRIDPPFQINAPLKYLVADFTNSAVERNGNSASIYFPMPFKEMCALQFTAAVNYNSFRSRIRTRVKITYIENPVDIDEHYYFHAQYNTGIGNGYDDYQALAAHGNGHFVGVNIFNNGHDHGGGDNIMFDAGTDTPGQLHGICGEDYFHMAYMSIWNRTPYSGCPRHDSRYRYHLEMPIPFEESFVFNLGLFYGQPVQSVAFWYQEELAGDDNGQQEFVYEMHGPFKMEDFDKITPQSTLPDSVYPYFWSESNRPVKSDGWLKESQEGFVDLCHIHRKHILSIPYSHGVILSNICSVAETKLWSKKKRKVTFKISADDPFKMYINGKCVLNEKLSNEHDPLKSFTVKAQLDPGVNRIFFVVSNTENFNWHWNGFAMKLVSEIEPDELYCMLPYKGK